MQNKISLLKVYALVSVLKIYKKNNIVKVIILYFFSSALLSLSTIYSNIVLLGLCQVEPHACSLIYGPKIMLTLGFILTS